MLNLEEKWEEGFSYPIYQTMIENLLGEGKTTGTNHSEAMIHYTKMNVQRMKRLDKTVKIKGDLAEVLKQIKSPQNWLVLTEAWCGDAAQIVPVLVKMAEKQSNVNLRLLLRDEHDSLMKQFLTNGARAIPKLLVMDESFQVIHTWGPRPNPAQEMIIGNKTATKPKPYEEIGKDLQLWYAKDKTQTIQAEFIELLRKSRIIK